MSAIGQTPSLRHLDRAAYVVLIADSSRGALTVQQVAAEEEESDQRQLTAAQNYESFLAGGGTYLGSVRGTQQVWDPASRDCVVEQARAARVDHYRFASGPVQIEALNIDSAVQGQTRLTGSDLKGLAAYAEYLKNEVAAATKARGEVSFVGAWGSNRMTNDVHEYATWLMQAARLAK